MVLGFTLRAQMRYRYFDYEVDTSKPTHRIKSTGFDDLVIKSKNHQKIITLTNERISPESELQISASDFNALAIPAQPEGEKQP